MGDNISGEVREAAVMQLEYTYNGCRQRTVDHWISLRPIFEVCAREKGYKWGGGGGTGGTRGVKMRHPKICSGKPPRRYRGRQRDTKKETV